MKIKIDGRFYDFFNDISINFKLDSVASAFSFKARFNPENEFHRYIFRPLGYRLVEVFTNDDKLLLTGISTRVDLGSTAQRQLQAISGYSKGGILENTTIPIANYPLEREGVSLNQVVRSVLNGIPVNYRVDRSAVRDMNLIYEKTVAKPSETIKSFIAKLSAQRNILLCHDAKGDIVFFKPTYTGAPRRSYNDTNTVSMALSANGQDTHSKITVLRQPSKDNTDLTPLDTITNPLVNYNLSIVKTLSKGDETDTRRAADNVLAAELKSIPIEVVLNKIDAELIPGDLVEVTNPEVYLFNPTKLVVSEIMIKESNATEKMTLKLVLPEAFTGNRPANIFNT